MGASLRLTAHPSVPAVSFTGGTATGRVVAAAAASRFAKCSLELGGKNAAIVLGDVADDPATLAAVAAGVARSCFLNR